VNTNEFCNYEKKQAAMANIIECSIDRCAKQIWCENSTIFLYLIELQLQPSLKEGNINKLLTLYNVPTRLGQYCTLVRLFVTDVCLGSGALASS
jgi:hypothetical protein